MGNTKAQFPHILPLHASLCIRTGQAPAILIACSVLLSLISRPDIMVRGGASKIKRCPLPLCPAPTLFVGRSGSQRHCVGCWRQFTPGDTAGSLCTTLGRQVPPPSWMLRRYSPHQLASGPPPPLLSPYGTVPNKTSHFADDDEDPASSSGASAHDGPDSPDVADVRRRYPLSSSENYVKSKAHAWKEWRYYYKGGTVWRFKRETIECEGCSECVVAADTAHHEPGYIDESD